MTDRVLTDDEVQSLINDKWWFSKHSAAGEISLARAVEAATLAKVEESQCLCVLQSNDGLNGLAYHRHNDYIRVLRSRQGITEREARTRERTAWDACFHFVGKLCGGFNLGPRYDYPERERDRLYPLPTVKRPRTVTLSDGTTVRMESDGTWFWSGVRKPFYAPAPLVHGSTPADARLLADLVESPYEEVPE